VDNAPTRPPGRSRNGRRPPRGPRLVPLSRDDNKRVELTKQAAEHLRTGGPARPELADAVDFLLTDEGRKFIVRLGWQDTAQRKPNLAMEIPVTLRDDIKEVAAAAGAKLEAEAEHALREFLAGRFTPAQPKKAPRGKTPAKANLNVRVDRELRRRADELGQRLLAEDELDWAPRASNVIVSWFTDRLEDDFRNPVKKTDAPAESE
jgi:hypothetical protein